MDQNARAAARARERNTNDTHTKTRTHASHTGGPSRCMLLQNNTASRYRERRGGRVPDHHQRRRRSLRRAWRPSRRCASVPRTRQLSMRRWQEWYAVQKESLERRQRAAVERGGEGSAAGVGDLGVQEDELLELRQHSCRKRRRTCRRRRRRRHARAARPSSPNGLPMRPIINSAGRRRLRPAPGPPAPRRRRCGVVQSELLIYIANVGVRFGRHAKPL